MKKILKWLAISVLLLFISVTIYNKMNEKYIEEIVTSQKETGFNGYVKVEDKNETYPYGLEPEYNIENVEPISRENIIKERNNIKEAIPKGRILIPTVGIDLNIYEGLNNAHLLLGASEQLPRDEQQAGHLGNYILAGHSYRTLNEKLFDPIKDIKIGDKIYVTGFNELYVYKTFYSKMTDDSDRTLLDQVYDKSIITLYTCESSYRITPERYVVQGELTEKFDISEIDEEEFKNIARKAFN